MTQETFEIRLKVVAQSVDQKTRRLQINFPQSIEHKIRGRKCTPTGYLTQGLKLNFSDQGVFALEMHKSSGFYRLTIGSEFLGDLPNAGLTHAMNVVGIWWNIDSMLALPNIERMTDRNWPMPRGKHIEVVHEAVDMTLFENHTQTQSTPEVDISMSEALVVQEKT